MTAKDKVFNERTSAIGNKKILANRYVVHSVLHESDKGRVCTVIDRKFLSFKVYVAKEAKAGAVDINGVPVVEYLKWEKGVYESLYATGHVPKVIDFFQEFDTSYLIVEYISDLSLQQFISDVYQGRAWETLDALSRTIILQCYLQVLDLIDSIHRAGFIHRDISDSNFLIRRYSKRRKDADKNKFLYVVDLESCFSVADCLPNPPYGKGTPAYSSPQTSVIATPVLSDDVYSLGGLLFFMLTNQSPCIRVKDGQLFDEAFVSASVSDVSFSKLIILCIADDPADRPTVAYIRNEINKQVTLLLPEVVAINRKVRRFKRLRSFVNVVGGLLAFLFVSTGFSKLVNHSNFELTLSKSPFIFSYAHILSYAVPIGEIIFSVCLAVKMLKTFGLYAGFFTMCAFSWYVYFMLSYSYSLPCSCGGIVQLLDWRQHLALNIGLSFSAAVAVLVHVKILKDEKDILPVLLIGGSGKMPNT
jgi:serine/threonine protein kinase